MVRRAYVALKDENYEPIIVDIIVTWGKLDETLDLLIEVMSSQLECKGIVPPRSSAFQKRLAHFNSLCRAYFVSAPSMVKFSDQTYNKILSVKNDRDLVAHGRYGWQISYSDQNSVGEIDLMLTELKDQGPKTKIYTKSQFQNVADVIGECLQVLYLHANEIPFAKFPKFLEERWSISNSQVASTKLLLSRIQEECEAIVIARLNS
ncbi:hypothetical protein [Duganella phyllosphaerae]|uniref:Uncharacterized protein n=1 Tax=Duganella phyllosphaerae TaxID=762836 RepID=A0A1E7W623_9BURK|nr:hypothetical protein [Duganella phyllosphaerae]OEZ91447.1 hypothetical protein DUPY_50590 [Duganella phyllosphaerae]